MSVLVYCTCLCIRLFRFETNSLLFLGCPDWFRESILPVDHTAQTALCQINQRCLMQHFSMVEKCSEGGGILGGRGCLCFQYCPLLVSLYNSQILPPADLMATEQLS